MEKGNKTHKYKGVYSISQGIECQVIIDSPTYLSKGEEYSDIIIEQYLTIRILQGYPDPLNIPYFLN